MLKKHVKVQSLLLYKAILKLEGKDYIFNKIHCLEPTANIILDSDALEDFLFTLGAHKQAFYHY